VKKTDQKNKGGNHLKQDISMLALMANQNTSDCRKLLQELGEPDAKNHLDLELKLAEVYKKAPDKLVIEEKFAKLHPHKDFILKHLTPKEEKKPDPVVVEKVDEISTESKSNCCGMSGFDSSCNCPSCLQQKSSACGCQSSFDGTKGSSQNEVKNDNTIIGMVSIVAILGMILIIKK